MTDLDLVIGGANFNKHFERRSEHIQSIIFHGSINDMPFFTPYFRESWLPTVEGWLYHTQLSPLTMIYAINYSDRNNPQKRLTTWIAYSDDKSIGWYRYEGLVAGGGQQTLVHENVYYKMPGRTRFRIRNRPIQI